jgi:FSR family fosmidomycin resistance protein-like MFS transporter
VTADANGIQPNRVGNVLIRNRPLATLMLGHFTVDMYVGLLPILYPLLMERFTLDLKTVGLTSLAYSGVAAISQPFFGWIADRYGTRFTGLALLWTGLTFATIGFAPTFGILLALAALAGLGSGAFHPLGAVNASAVIPEGHRNTAMSIYVTGGTIGVASGPVVGALIFTLFGVHGTAMMIFPGAGIALWLLYEMRSIALPRPDRNSSVRTWSQAPIPTGVIAVIVGVMMARALTLFGIQAFIPTWYAELGYSATFYGPLATTIILASAVGAIGSGRLADRFGRRGVILWSLVASIPPLLLFTWITGPTAFISGALIGLTAASTAPLLLGMAQQLMQGRAGMASGVILGLGFVAGAIGVPLIGAIADQVGIANAMRMQVLVVVATVGLAWLLPRDERVAELSRIRSVRRQPGPIKAS